MNNVLFINESLFKVDNTIKPYEKAINNAILNFCKEEFGFDAKITFRKTSGNKFIGDVVLNDNSLNHNKFTVHYNSKYGYSARFKIMFHELTHVKQISNGELRPSDDWKSLLWKDDFEISVIEYKKVMKKGPEQYNLLPWEVEAIRNQKDKSLLDKFLQSSYLKDLKGSDVTIDAILQALEDGYI